MLFFRCAILFRKIKNLINWGKIHHLACDNGSANKIPANYLSLNAQYEVGIPDYLKNAFTSQFWKHPPPDDCLYVYPIKY